jgi:hypothetical protein
MHATELITSGNILALVFGGIICLVVFIAIFKKSK